MEFVDTYPGQYVTQAVFHSLVVAMAVEALMRLWRLQRPWPRLKLGLPILALPLLTWPLYTLIYPARTGWRFADTTALFSLSRWLRLEVGGHPIFGYLFLLAMAIALLFFLFQEAFPALQRRLAREEPGQSLKPGQIPKLDEALGELSRLSREPPPVVLLSHQPRPVLYARTTGRGAIVLSPALVAALDPQELVAVLAHEQAHLQRRDRLLAWGLWGLRLLTGYNPVALFASRRLFQEKERLCDEEALRLLGQPLPIASGLLKVLQAEVASAEGQSTRRRGPLSWLTQLEDRASLAAVENRGRGILHSEANSRVSLENARLAFTVGMLAVLLFFVV